MAQAIMVVLAAHVAPVHKRAKTVCCAGQVCPVTDARIGLLFRQAVRVFIWRAGF